MCYTGFQIRVEVKVRGDLYHEKIFDQKMVIAFAIFSLVLIYAILEVFCCVSVNAVYGTEVVKFLIKEETSCTMWVLQNRLL